MFSKYKALMQSIRKYNYICSFITADLITVVNNILLNHFWFKSAHLIIVSNNQHINQDIN